MLRLLFTAGSLLFTSLLFAQSDSFIIRKISDEIFVNGRAYSNLHTLTKTVGPRLSGSPQTYKAEDWGV
ncbi:MAG TPA: peptidase M28 family protein, partial [Puia sp.]|nr:peptidase M28 family protein [Puia sp.]